jgi:proteinaceous RNase P
MTQISDASDKTYETKEKPCDIRGIRNIKVSRRFKKNPEEIVSLLRLHTCSKYGDLHGALELYDEVKRGGTIKPNMSFYSSLLYICSGAASGTLTRSKSGREKKPEGTRSKENGDSVGVMSEESVENNNELIHFSPEDMQLAARRGMEVYEHMLEVQAPFNEAIFTSLSRLAVATGDGDWAFDIVKKMASQGIAPRLRSYGPALLCFCENNDIHKAFEVDKHMEEAGVLPDENILANLLKVSIEAGEEKKVYSLLHRLRKRVRDLSSTTVTTIESWFTGEIASSIGESRNKRLSTEEIRKTIEANGGGWHGLGWLGKGKWEVKRTNLSKEGLCLSCGERLCTIDLDPVETAEFADTIARFACEREHLPNQFKEFQV